jgi:8-amino-3,8-dideoxy-alpha-D-manno-octulosonate transaminase
VAEFEHAACAFLGCRYAVAVANGTAALRCALAALGVGCGDEVIVPAFTFVATVNAVVAAGAVPVFAEIDDTLGLDPTDLDAQITDRTTAIVAVHLENVACDLHALLAVAERRGIAVIEDAARDLAPHLVAFYLKDLAAIFHSYYNSTHFLVDDERARRARLSLIVAVRQVLASGLGILGVSAPTKM